MNALRELPQDDRDLKLGSIFTLPDVANLPTSFKLDDRWTGNQKGTDFCSAFATVGASMLQEGVELSPEFSFALSKVISGDPDEFGQDLRTACLVHTKFGALEKGLAPLTVDDADKARRIEYWGEQTPLLNNAIIHKKDSFMSAGKSFDEIRAALYRFKNEKRAVVFGTIWDNAWSMSQKVMENVPQAGGGHAMRIIGWEGDYMVVKNNYGEATPNGEHLFHKSIINAMAPRFGSFMFSDISPQQARYYQENGVKSDGDLLRRVLLALYKALQKLFKASETGAIPSKTLLQALCWQESDVSLNAVGDKHLRNNAYGILQIRQPYMTDVYKWRNANECLNNLPLSIDVFNKYMARYATEKRLGRPVTDQDIARLHNGGPNGYKNPNTLLYWYQVKKKMEQLQNGTAPQFIVERLKVNNLL